jgi:hypothetical protein
MANSAAMTAILAFITKVIISYHMDEQSSYEIVANEKTKRLGCSTLASLSGLVKNLLERPERIKVECRCFPLG